MSVHSCHFVHPVAFCSHPVDDLDAGLNLENRRDLVRRCEYIIDRSYNVYSTYETTHLNARSLFVTSSPPKQFPEERLLKQLRISHTFVAASTPQAQKLINSQRQSIAAAWPGHERDNCWYGGGRR